MKCQILLSRKNEKNTKETICMKCQILFSRKNAKNISKCLLKFLPSMLSVNLKFEQVNIATSRYV